MPLNKRLACMKAPSPCLAHFDLQNLQCAPWPGDNFPPTIICSEGSTKAPHSIRMGALMVR